MVPACTVAERPLGSDTWSVKVDFCLLGPGSMAELLVGKILTQLIDSTTKDRFDKDDSRISEGNQ